MKKKPIKPFMRDAIAFRDRITGKIQAELASIWIRRVNRPSARYVVLVNDLELLYFADAEGALEVYLWGKERLSFKDTGCRWELERIPK